MICDSPMIFCCFQGHKSHMLCCLLLSMMRRSMILSFDAIKQEEAAYIIPVLAHWMSGLFPLSEKVTFLETFVK